MCLSLLQRPNKIVGCFVGRHFTAISFFSLSSLSTALSCCSSWILFSSSRYCCARSLNQILHADRRNSPTFYSLLFSLDRLQETASLSSNSSSLVAWVDCIADVDIPLACRRTLSQSTSLSQMHHPRKRDVDSPKCIPKGAISHEVCRHSTPREKSIDAFYL